MYLSKLLIYILIVGRYVAAADVTVDEQHPVPENPMPTVIEDEASIDELPPRAWGIKEDNQNIERVTPNAETQNSMQDTTSDEARRETTNEQADPDEATVTKTQHPRRWGAHALDVDNSGDEDNEGQQIPTNNTHVPFLTKKKRIEPPAGYKISARVFIDPHDKLAHFDFHLPVIPYFECSSTGLTTTQIPLQHANIRHSLAHTHSVAFSGTDTTHPIIMVALNPCVVELNSKETLTLQAGQMILLEDVLKPGHKVSGLDDHELSVLFLTLPVTHHHVGKSNLSLEKLKLLDKNIPDPCPAMDDPDSVVFLSSNNVSRRLGSASSRTVRTIAWGLIGLSLSTLAADFLGKTAPLWLAVGVGGTCFVAGTTYGFVTLVENMYQRIELILEQRKLARSEDDTARQEAS